MATGTPKYSLIMDQLLRDIQSGSFSVGEALPTETELMRAYGVSRHTVRYALQGLRSRGVIASRQGQGSKVVSDGIKSALVERIQSVDELIAFGRDTERTLIRVEKTTANAELAEVFQSEPCRHLLEVHMLRHFVGERERPIAYLTLWMDALFEPVIEDLERHNKSVAELLEFRFKRPVGFVHQTVSAGALDEPAAKYLGRAVGEPALKIERAYAENADTPIHLLARTTCAPDAVKLESSFQSTSEGAAKAP